MVLIDILRQFSVGSYLLSRMEFRDMSPNCSIYRLQIALVQTYSVIPIEEFSSGQYDPEEHQYPSDTFLLCSEGQKPATDRPGKDEPVLWRGASLRETVSEDTAASNSFAWQPSPIRLPDDAAIRPTTLLGYVFDVALLPLLLIR